MRYLVWETSTETHHEGKGSQVDGDAGTKSKNEHAYRGTIVADWYAPPDQPVRRHVSKKKGRTKAKKACKTKNKLPNSC